MALFDYNSDSVITQADALHLRMYALTKDAVTYPIDQYPFPNFVNTDQNITQADALHLRMYALTKDAATYPISIVLYPEIVNDHLELKLKPENLKGAAVSGMQLYVQGVQLESKVNESDWLPSDGAVLTDANGGDWIIACNTINAADNLSIVYLERNNDKELTKDVQSGADTVTLAKFPIQTGTTPSSARIKTTVTSGDKTYTSMVVGVENQTIVEYNLL